MNWWSSIRQCHDLQTDLNLTSDLLGRFRSILMVVSVGKLAIDQIFGLWAETGRLFGGFRV